MKCFFAALLLACVSGGSAQNSQPLFPFYKGDLTGYINENGKQVIAATYKYGGGFTEGLAPVRVNGTYGYIDETGTMVIADRYDYALPFSEGLAVVWLNGQPQVINRQGRQAFKTDFLNIDVFSGGLALVQAKGGNFGYINRQGTLVIDTVYRRINGFVNGRSIVTGANHRPYADKETGAPAHPEQGIIDTLGNFILPFGKYIDVTDLNEGYYRAWPIAEKNEQVFFVDAKGIITKVKPLPDKIKYETDFSYNRAFVYNDGVSELVDRTGHAVTQQKFKRVITSTFTEGYAFVSDGDLTGMIDTNGRWVIKPKYEEVSPVGVVNGYFFFSDYPEEEEEQEEAYDEDDDGLRYGIARTNGTTVLKPCMDNFSADGFVNGLLLCIINKKLSYVNTAGKIVWQQEKQAQTQLKPLNMDYMNRGYFYAYSEPDSNDIGGFGRSANSPQPVTAANNFAAGLLGVVVRPEEPDTFYGEYRGIKVYVHNTTTTPVKFEAQDSRLYIKVQALDTDGTWKDIEYLPSSWCGNSYHTLTLNPNRYWQFVTPQYSGSFKTQLRIELKYLVEKGSAENDWKSKEATVYSAPYTGYVNPAQFWRKQTYYPGGIMDPYND